MTLFKTFAAILAALFTASGAISDGITIEDAYALSSGKMAKSGAAFMIIHNNTDTEDRLISVESDAAKMVQLHTHRKSSDGVIKMEHVPNGFLVPANGIHMLSRGKDHVMFMGLKSAWDHGKFIPLRLFFKNAGEMDIQIEVDLKR